MSGSAIAALILLASPVEPISVMPDQPALVTVQPSPAQEAPAVAPDTEEHDIVVTARQRAVPGDPLQEFNLKSYRITQDVDRALVAPVAHAYEKSVPGPVRGGLRNILWNLREPCVFLNFLLQIKPGKAAETLARFTVNTTLGGAGLFDVAKRKPFYLPRRPNGFADTMGFYGVRPGAYLFLPIVGPTTVRDLIGGGLDRFVLPVAIGDPFNKLYYSVTTGLISSFDHRVQFDEQLNQYRNDTSDPYVAAREFYLKSRQAEIDELRHHFRKPVPASAL